MVVACGVLVCLACSEGSGVGAHRTHATIDPDEERRGKETAAAAGTGAPAATVTEPVDAPAAAALDPFDGSALPEPARERLADVPLPVLLPAPEAIGGDRPYRAAVATRGPRWYSVAVPGDTVHLSVFGTGESVARPGMAEPGDDPSPAEGAPRIGRTHGIVQATFQRFGVSYAVEVECTDPTSDPRCAEDGFVLRLVGAMQRLGGGR